MKLPQTLIATFLLASLGATAQPKPDTVFLQKLLQSRPDLFGQILNHPTHNEVQILYTQIDRDKNNVPHFTSYSYCLNPNHYFYPASTVKLPTLLFALEKLHTLKSYKVTPESTMITDSAFNRQSRVKTDTSAANGLPSIANYGKKILLVSDNDAYNRVYEFVGRAEINNKLKQYSLNNTHIVGRLAIGDGGENAKHTNPIDFYKGGKLLYHQPPQYDSTNYVLTFSNVKQGKGHLDRNDQLVMEPFDFSKMNVYPIADQQLVLKRLIFPEAFPASQRYKLDEDDYHFVYKYMSMYPTESKHPTYNRPEYFPTFCKFLFYGADSAATLNPNVRIFNKVGDSYGYIIDNAYIVDFKNKVEFMVTAVVQSNEDGIYNDNKYEYATVCLPFMKNLGQTLYEYELKRNRKYQPNLSKFKLNYRK